MNRRNPFPLIHVAGALLAAMVALPIAAAAQGGSIYQATLAEAGEKTPEISTEEMRRIVANGSAMVIDSRSRAEYAAGHIPGARHVDAPPSQLVEAIARLLQGDRRAPLVLYCNGPYCRASRRLGEELAAAGFAGVRRYQLGIPVWRALGGPTVIELDGVRRIFGVDRTAVFLDARSPAEYSQGTLPGAHNLPLDAVTDVGLQKAGASVMPTDDFNTRIVLFGRDATQAHALAQVLSTSPWHNVTYFNGTFEALKAGLR